MVIHYGCVVVKWWWVNGYFLSSMAWTTTVPSVVSGGFPNGHSLGVPSQPCQWFASDRFNLGHQLVGATSYEALTWPGLPHEPGMTGKPLQLPGQSSPQPRGTTYRGVLSQQEWGSDGNHWLFNQIFKHKWNTLQVELLSPLCWNTVLVFSRKLVPSQICWFVSPWMITKHHYAQQTML